MRKKNLVRVRVRKYGYVKEFAGVTTGTGYFEKNKFGKSTGTESFWIIWHVNSTYTELFL